MASMAFTRPFLVKKLLSSFINTVKPALKTTIFDHSIHNFILDTCY